MACSDFDYNAGHGKSNRNGSCSQCAWMMRVPNGSPSLGLVGGGEDELEIVGTTAF